MVDWGDLLDPTGIGRAGANVWKSAFVDPILSGPQTRPSRKVRWKNPPRSGPSGIRRSPQPGASPGGDLGDLYEQLLSQLTSPVGVNEDDLMAQIRGQYDPVFDARRAAIEQGMQRTEQRTQRGREDIEGSYEAFAQEYKDLAPEQREQAAQAQADIEQLYGELRSNIEGNYSRIAGEQEDLFAQLGIEGATEEVLDPQQEQTLQSMTAAEELGTQQQQRYMDIGNVDETYYREGAPLARLTGANRSTDLLTQLQDYLSEQEMGLQQLEAERTSGIQSAYNQLLSQSRSQAASQQQSQQQMLWQMLQSQMEGQQPQELTPETYYQTLPPELQQEVGAAFRSIERSEAVQTGQVPGRVGGTFVSTPDAYWLEAAEQMRSEGRISDQAYMALVNYIRMSFDMPGLGIPSG